MSCRSRPSSPHPWSNAANSGSCRRNASTSARVSALASPAAYTGHRSLMTSRVTFMAHPPFGSHIRLSLIRARWTLTLTAAIDSPSAEAMAA